MTLRVVVADDQLLVRAGLRGIVDTAADLTVVAEAGSGVQAVDLARGFLLKDTPPADLHAAIRIIAAGDALLAPSITRRLIVEFAARPEPSQRVPSTDALGSITDRERQVLTLIADGLSNTEIAQRLHITPGTAKTHVSNLLTKLGARDRVQLVIVAHRSGLAASG